jgi:hypothetical protein
MFTNWPALSEKEERKPAELQRRADQLEARRVRILNHKPKHFGLDVQFCGQQQDERNRALEAEREEENRRVTQEREVLGIMKAVADFEVEQRKARDLDLAEVWKQQSKRENRPEWDINDPNGVRDGVYSGADFGISSAQSFPGHEEGGTTKEKRRAKQRQQVLMLEEQLREKEQLRMLERSVEDAHARNVDEQVALTKQYEDLSAAQTYENNKAYGEWNAMLGQQKRAKQARERQDQLSQAQREHQFINNNGLLREDRTYNGVGAPVRSEWKGMTPEQLAEITEAQARQMRENQAQRDREAELERAYAENERQVKRQADANAQADADARRRQLLDTAAVHTNQVEEKRRKDAAYQGYREDNGFKSWWPFGRDGR